MDTCLLTLRFQADASTGFDALEAVLATARRTGLRLGELRMAAQADTHEVLLRVSHTDRDLLDNFQHRVHNLIHLHRVFFTVEITPDAAWK